MTPTERFFIGTYANDSETSGIYTGLLNPATGELGGIGLAVRAQNPTFLAQSPDGRFLYAAIEVSEGRVAAYSVETDGRLQLLNEQSSGGSGPAHVSVHPSGKFVFVANYGSGDIAVHPVIGGGALQPARQVVRFEGSGPDEQRQEASHAHGIYPSADGRFIYVCDLGTDRIHSFTFDNGRLTSLEPGTPPPGSGPRHLVFSADENTAFVANELSGSVCSFSRDRETGELTLLETVRMLSEDTVPVDQQLLSEIRLHPNGKWLYVGVRGHDSISVFEVHEQGRLALRQNISSGVVFPRGFALNPTGEWLIVAGQKDDQLKTFSVDPQSGELVPATGKGEAQRPVDVLFDNRTR